MNQDRTFDVRPSNDPRQDLFPMRAVLPTAVPRKQKLWQGPIPRLDQGREGACVGFGWTTELAASPVRVAIGGLGPANAMAMRVYNAAKAIDEWPGEDYEGTSVQAGAKVLQRAGYIDSYHWAQGISDIIDALVSVGPVIVGIPWYEGMYDTDAYGNVMVSGRVVGGHCICLTGYYPKLRGAERIRWRNSWGPSYGQNGDAFITTAALAQLLQGDPAYGQGEACLPTGRHLTATSGV